MTAALMLPPVQVPVVLIITVDGGRVAVAMSKGLYDLGPREWLPGFWGWLSAQDLGQPLVVSDTADDPRYPSDAGTAHCFQCTMQASKGSSDCMPCRTKDREWVTASPGIRFLVACNIVGSDGDSAGTM